MTKTARKLTLPITEVPEAEEWRTVQFGGIVCHAGLQRCGLVQLMGSLIACVLNLRPEMGGLWF